MDAAAVVDCYVEVMSSVAKPCFRSHFKSDLPKTLRDTTLRVLNLNSGPHASLLERMPKNARSDRQWQGLRAPFEFNTLRKLKLQWQYYNLLKNHLGSTSY